MDSVELGLRRHQIIFTDLDVLMQGVHGHEVDDQPLLTSQHSIQLSNQLLLGFSNGKHTIGDELPSKSPYAFYDAEVEKQPQELELLQQFSQEPKPTRTILGCFTAM